MSDHSNIQPCAGERLMVGWEEIACPRKCVRDGTMFDSIEYNPGVNYRCPISHTPSTALRTGKPRKRN